MANLITDVAGLNVGHGDDGRLRSGVTVLVPDGPVTAAVDIRGGGPASHETDALGPLGTVSEIHALVLSGGSAFGLQAAGAVQNALRARGVGFAVGPERVPIVPAAAIFDLLNSGDKAWGGVSPYPALALAAIDAADRAFALGSVGAGKGATCADVKGGLGSASAMTPDGFTVGALAVVNPVGSVLYGDGPHFRAAGHERDQEFGGLGLPAALDPTRTPKLKGHAARANTTLGVIATDATLTKPQAQRLAVMAQAGLAIAIWPAHSPLDGDCVFALATARKPAPADLGALTTLGAVAAATFARAIARGVYHATSFPDGPPAWRDLFSVRSGS